MRGKRSRNGENYIRLNNNLNDNKYYYNNYNGGRY